MAKTYNECIEFADSISEKELLDKLDKIDSCVSNLAIFADELNFVGNAELEGKIDKLLELRSFSSKGELHAVRDSLSGLFSCRVVADSDIDTNSFLDEVHLLDSDEKHRHDRNVLTTGGGSFVLPEQYEKASKVKIRNYLEYDEEEGLAHVVDFRIIGLE